MPDMLKRIIENKEMEVQVLLEQHYLNDLNTSIYEKIPDKSGKNFAEALRRTDRMAVIAEIKRQSPSMGEIAVIEDPLVQARRYLNGGADAVSVLTDQAFFGGSVKDLARVAMGQQLPVLRKDFIIHEIQLQEALCHGAAAVLLIVAVLGDKTTSLLQAARDLGLDCLVEVHNRDELTIALDAGAEIVGVNNRNLLDFSVDLRTSEQLAPYIPSHKIKVAESAIGSVTDVRRMAAAGYDAVLVGGALLTHSRPEDLIRRFVGVER